MLMCCLLFSFSNELRLNLQCQIVNYTIVRFSHLLSLSLSRSRVLNQIHCKNLYTYTEKSTHFSTEKKDPIQLNLFTTGFVDGFSHLIQFK